MSQLDPDSPALATQGADDSWRDDGEAGFASISSGRRAEGQLFDGDTGRFELALRQALIRLLRGPYLDGAADARLWQLVLDRRTEISAFVAELFLKLQVDTERKIALLVPVPTETVHTTAIVPRKPLRREETLLALRLRLLLDRHAGTGTDPVISRAGAREILEEHRHPGALDDKRLEELTDSSLARLAALKLILPTELEHEYRVSGALALALPFDSIDEIPAYLQSLDRAADEATEPTLDLDSDVVPDAPEENYAEPEDDDDDPETTTNPEGAAQ
ncbi:DUF4194 domain-containing protein [Arthrobacter rhombi]|uniref:DUF4194 domain-containing protein n=1 Tax=Arthrobacter rhombi TaxID=71253 RepID=A0A1R4FDS8_9MICC|nr:DUF4194 domain-containing protein [Arthrobacter rhombi]SJM53922.1 hypothetical protein FM101_03400 [Arthrobacter rhombi]